MANATEYEHRGGNGEETYAYPQAERHEIDASHQITLLETPVEGSVSIRGMEEVDASPELGEFTVDVSSKKVTFNASETGTIEVIYDSLKEVYEAIITNKEAAIGEAAAIWPVKLYAA